MPVAGEGPTLAWFLGSFAVVIAALVLVAVVIAALGVVRVGDRDRDSLIVPAMATFATILGILLGGRFAADDIPRRVALVVLTGVACAAIQRWVMLRFRDDLHA